MAEPIPSATEGEERRLPANAEDRKAAAALSSLNANGISQADDDGAGSNSKLSSAAAQEALGKAMSRLEIAAGGASKGAAGAGGAANKAAGDKAAAQKEEAARKKAVKIAAEDVTLLVEELDLTKNKATELLRSHDGDAKEAIRAFLTPSITA